MSTINLLEIKPDDHIKIIGADDLRLDELPELVYPDPADAEKRTYASTVLRSPLSDPDNIVHRREIARDFISSEGLLKKLEDISKDAREYRNKWQEETKQLIAKRYQEGAAVADSASDLHGKFEMARLNLSKFLELSDRLKELIDMLASSTLYAEGLLEFKETCIKLYASFAFSDVPRARKMLSADPDDFTVELLLGLNENLSVESVDLNMLYTQKDSEKPAGASAGAQSAARSSICSDVNASELMPMLGYALDSLGDRTVESCEQLLTLFRELSSELRFYRFCLDLCDALEKAGAHFMFPQVTEAETAVTSVIGLRDPLDVLSGKDYGVTHDILLTPERSGIVVTGPGGVGKTALLRSVCTAQILTQCGLPVICFDASLSVRSGIFVCFTDVSDPNKDLLKRFESEAQAIAKIIDSLMPYALVALNELFETVNFADASDALYNIFSVMTQHNIAFFATTHMPRLAERFIEVDRITVMSMSEKSRLETVGSR